ncbi:hypothetical protein [Chitinophaga caseinilytica]|uniref:capsular polysaccharide export protein, LipB/KpsS family n=1 Tax=Chitinophaga caseinilytica TaxID=2267521 RepID=UPI003C2E5990
MSTFLILINNAPLMAPYHRALGEKLEKSGHKVLYAHSDNLPATTYGLTMDPARDYVFSEFFRDNFNNTSIPEVYRDINLWGAFFSDYDRNIVHYDFKHNDYNYYYSLLANLVNFFDRIMKDHQIDAFIYENISNSFAHVCFEVARKNKVRFLGYCVSRLPNRFEIQEEVLNMVEKFATAYDNTSTENIPEELDAEIMAYISKYDNVIPSYHSISHPLSYKYSLLKKYTNSNKVRMFLSALKFSVKKSSETDFNYQIFNPVRNYQKLMWRQIKRKVKGKIASRMFDKVDPDERFFLFPLQMKPESSTSVWAKHFVDEISLIKNIAFNLPYGTKLYVKEHFVNLGNLPLSVYRELKKIPNVKLIHPLEPNTPLLRSSIALITLTSTMGFEALVMGKTVVCFGDIFYKKHPRCINLREFDSLFQILSNIDKNEKTDLEITRRFVAAYYHSTYPGNINFAAYPAFDPERFTSVVSNAIGKVMENEATEN